MWPLLNPPKCHDCVSIHVLSHDPVAHLLTVEVMLRNPTSLTGWFVRGVVDTPDGSGVELLEPDGWWHSDLQAREDEPAPFMTFGDYGPGVQEIPPHSCWLGAG